MFSTFCFNIFQYIYIYIYLILNGVFVFLNCVDENLRKTKKQTTGKTMNNIEKLIKNTRATKKNPETKKTYEQHKKT